MTKKIYIAALILLVSCRQSTNISNKITDNSSKDTNIVVDTLSKKEKDKFNSQLIIPENYSELKESPSNGRKMERIVVDLDYDKKADTSFIVQNKNDFANYLLILHLTSQNKTYRLRLIDNFELDLDLSPVQLKVRNNVLEVGYIRDGTAAFSRFLKFRFDKKEKNIKLIGYDSRYRIGAGEDCEKSYDLLSGDYIVKLQKSLPNDHTETFTGNEKIGNVYINDIDIKLLDKLDKVGSKYEPK